jgi:hypothetical protein
MDVPDQLGGGGLAVGARDGDELIGQQTPGELELAQHRYAVGTRAYDHRCLCGNAWALDDCLHTL